MIELTFQPPFALCDVAVVMPTILRPSIVRAIKSIRDQNFNGTIHLVIGVDFCEGERGCLEQVSSMQSDQLFITVLDPGYSTSKRHGGLWEAYDGGALRTILSYSAHSRHVTYLDDDNWWHESHVSSLLSAVGGKDWAFSKRWFVDPENGEVLCEDDWESVGPKRGVFSEKLGGWCDPNTLIIDKVKCEPLLRAWCHPLPNDPKAMSADRQVFHLLKENHPWGETGKASVYYPLDPNDGMHAQRMAEIDKRRA